MGEFDIHRHQRNIEMAYGLLERDANVSPQNKKVILSFSKMRLAKGSGRLRVVKCVYCLRYLAKWLKKPFEEATKEDIIGLVGEIESQKYSENTKYDIKVVLKIFYKWLRGNDEIYPPEISWLKPRLRNDAHKLPEQLLTEEEVLRMAQAAENPRDRAFILVLYETGCRIGELLTLRLRHVQFDQYGAILRVTGKTGDRRVRIISSAPALSAWYENYSYGRDQDAPLWPPLSTNQRHKGEPMEYQAVYLTLKAIAKKVNISKKIYPHLFRHSRATALAGKLTEAQMKEYFGWVQSSEMASVYVHLSGRDVDKALLALQGLVKPEDNKEEQMRVCFCLRCKEKNSPIAKFCLRCGSPMDARAAVQIEEEQKAGSEMFNRLMQDSEFKEFMFKKAVALGFGSKLA